jgi:hypothetical protein
MVCARREVGSYHIYTFIPSLILPIYPPITHTTSITMPVQKRKEAGMTGYNALWDKQAAKDTAEHVKSRVDNYTELVNGMSRALGLPSAFTDA